MSVISAHIYTCILVNIHFLYTYYICTVYLVDIIMTLLSTIFVFCCLSPIFFFVNLITMEILVIYCNAYGKMAVSCGSFKHLNNSLNNNFTALR